MVQFPPVKTLILETATEKAFIALTEGSNVLAFQPLSGGPELSKRLALEVSTLLSSTRPEQIAVGSGPGSFTGLRVGAALAQALAFGWQTPLVSFPSLLAFAPTTAPFAILVDARMGGIYVQRETGPAYLAQPQDLFLKDIPLFSPHPALIQKRLPLPIQEATPSPRGLLFTPFSLNYCQM